MTTIAGISGALAILLGAFGAHGLKSKIQDERLLKAFETGAHYHLVHSVVLLALGDNIKPTTQALFLAGIGLFSGSLYVLSLNRNLGMITPFGGLFLVAGWASLAF